MKWYSSLHASTSQSIHLLAFSGSDRFLQNQQTLWDDAI